MKTLRLVCSLMLIAAFFVEAIQAEEPVRLRYKMSPGDRLVYRITEEEKQSSRLNGIAVGAVKSTAMTIVVVWTVERVDDAGNFHIRGENQRLRVKINTDSINFEYDSSKPEEAKDQDGKSAEMLSSMMKVLSGATRSFVMTPRGEIKEAEFEGPTAELAKIMGKFGTAMFGAPAGDGEEEGERPRPAPGEEFLILPENAVQPGDTWTAAYGFELSTIEEERQRVFQYEGPNQVDGRSTVRIDIQDEQTLVLGPTDLAITLSTESSSGTAQFSPADGQLISLDTSHTLSGPLPVPKELPGLKAPPRIEKTRKTTVELLDEVPVGGF